MSLCFDDVINIMLAFLRNYAIFVICTKNETICETESVNMLIWADEACHFTDLSKIQFEI